MIINLFKLTDKKILKVLGRKAYLRNGVGYGFVSDEYLYDNGFLEIGFGRTESGYGDWGGGFDRATTCPLKITIDRNYIIHKMETSSFYNSKESEKVELKAIKLMKKLKVGSKFKIDDTELKSSIDAVFSIIPCKHHIGWDIFDSPHMKNHFTNMQENRQYGFGDSKCLANTIN